MIQHNLDIKDIEKNVFYNIVNTNLNVKQTKDNPKARLDMVNYYDRSQLEKDANGSYPKAAYTIWVAYRTDWAVIYS